MTTLVRCLCLGVALAALPLFARAAEPVGPQSPAKPWPTWVKIIDQGRTDPELKGYFTPEGIKVEIVARAPAVVNPRGIAFAADGTLYVVEAKAVKTLSWNGERGALAPRFPEAKPVLENLDSTSGILLHDGWLYHASSGSLWRYTSTKSDGKYDVKEEIARGFASPCGLTIGNDGWLYLTSGEGDNFAAGADGSRATVLRTGAVFRCRPDGSRMHVHSIGYRNPHGNVAFDAAFNIFHVDSDVDAGCRLMHVAEEADFDWRSGRGELPGSMPALLNTGRGASGGLLVYNDTCFPEPYRGLLLYADALRLMIRAYRVEQRGASFEIVEEFEFMKSDDPLFRPCQLVVGPDGAIYVCDGRSPPPPPSQGGEKRDDGERGRIYRLTWSGTKEHPAIATRAMDSWEKLVKGSDEELLKALESETLSDRQQAQRELVRRGEKSRGPLLKLLANSETPVQARLAVVGGLQSLWNADARAGLIKALAGPESDLKRLAADGLALSCAKGDGEAHNALIQLLTDNDHAVRRAAALAIGRIAAPGAADALVNTLKFDDGRDVYLRDGLIRGIERLGKPGIDALLDLADSGVQKEIAACVKAFTTLRTRPAADALPRLLQNVNLDDDDRAALLRSYGNYLLDPPVSPEPLLDWLAKNPDARPKVKAAAVEAVATASLPAGARVEKFLLDSLDDKDAGVRISAVRAAGALGVKRAAAVLARALGDEQKPAGERAAALHALNAVDSAAALASACKLLAHENAELRDAARAVVASWAVFRLH